MLWSKVSGDHVSVFSYKPHTHFRTLERNNRNASWSQFHSPSSLGHRLLWLRKRFCAVRHLRISNSQWRSNRELKWGKECRGMSCSLGVLGPKPQEDGWVGWPSLSTACSLAHSLSPTSFLAVWPLKDGTQNRPVLRWQRLIAVVAHLKV